MSWLNGGTGLEVGLALALPLGTVMGSLACAVAWRLPRGQDWVSGRSCCTACGARLQALDLVPLLSWLVLRGRCRHCGGRISARYPVTEAATALAFAAPVLANGGLWVDLLPAWLLAVALMILTLVDISHRLIPDGCTLLVVASWFPASLTGMAPSASEALIAAALLGGGTWLVRWVSSAAVGREALGLGDVKLFAAAGLWIGPAAIGWLLVLSALAGLAWHVIEHQRSRGEAPMPFGPFIAWSLYGLVVWPPAISPLQM